MLGLDYDGKMEPPRVFLAAPSLAGAQLTTASLGIERGFTRMTVLAYVLKWAFVDATIDQWDATDLATLRTCPH